LGVALGGVKEEAGDWVAAEIARLRALSYEELLGLEGREIERELRASSGESLVMQTQVLWDDGRGVERDLRVIVDVWWPGSGKRVIGSLAVGDFIRGPRGFVGE
jgi:hypothetical protein